MKINKSNQLIGLSLSYCISDILTKQVELDTVLKLYTSCLWKSEQELEDLLRIVLVVTVWYINYSFLLAPGLRQGFIYWLKYHQVSRIIILFLL